jgi:hypothetical protein
MQKTNNRKTILFLIPITLFIWGFVGYKIIQYLSKVEEDTVTGSIRPMVKQMLPADTNSLNLSYTDPFLRDYDEQSELSSPEVEQTIPKPNITYFGMVKNNSTGVIYANLEWNAEKLILKAGMEFNGMRLIRIYQDSVFIRLDGQLFTILKK